MLAGDRFRGENGPDCLAGCVLHHHDGVVDVGEDRLADGDEFLVARDSLYIARRLRGAERGRAEVSPVPNLRQRDVVYKDGRKTGKHLCRGNERIEQAFGGGERLELLERSRSREVEFSACETAE